MAPTNGRRQAAGLAVTVLPVLRVATVAGWRLHRSRARLNQRIETYLMRPRRRH